MSRLLSDSNVLVNGFYWFTILDDEKESCNYIARTKGCYRDHDKDEYICIKCLKTTNWYMWHGKKATATCECGQKHSLEYITLGLAKPRK